MKNMFMKNIKNENSLKRLIYIFRVVVRNICGAYVTEFWVLIMGLEEKSIGRKLSKW